MRTESRVKRWRANKREQGLKHVSVWVTEEEELRLKDLALQWHCSPSQVMQRALAQVAAPAAPQNGSPPDTSLIRELIRAELAAMQDAPAAVTGGITVGPPDTKAPAGPAYTPEHGHSLLTEEGQPADACPPFDPTNNVLGKLCPRRHEWGTTGQSLLRRSNFRCRTCENAARRE